MPYKDPERRRAYGREWMRKNPDKAREAMRRWRQRHPEDHAAEGRAFYARHRQRLDARMLAYNRAHPQIVRAKSENYRARRLEAVGGFTPDEWRDLIRAHRGRCAYCGRRADLVVEHVVPLSRDGTNEITNIVPACRSCNAQKHRMTEDEFINRLRRKKRRVRPSLRRAGCPQHAPNEGCDQPEGQQP